MDFSKDYNRYSNDIKKLYISAFPQAERREEEILLKLLKTATEIECLVIVENHLFCGFIIIWDFSEFVFIEHFATIPEIRGKGVGSKTIAQIREIYKKPILLEVEPTSNCIETQKRISFYEKLDFIIISKNYYQPSYKNDGKKYPMWLMSHGQIKDIQKAVYTIHKHVYLHDSFFDIL